jgi:hypothetical protein
MYPAGCEVDLSEEAAFSILRYPSFEGNLILPARKGIL